MAMRVIIWQVVLKTYLDERLYMLFNLFKKKERNTKSHNKKNRILLIRKKATINQDKKHEEQDNKIFDPIVFVNNPLNTEEKDVIGLNSVIASIKAAINKGAKMIGVIADYGTGKSSLIELLARKSDHTKIIKINMWDCLHAKKESEDSLVSVSNLTKSFLYQLASGCSLKLAQYINKRLSKNYGIISFSIKSKSFWIYIIPALILFVINLIINNATQNGIGTILNVLNIELVPWTTVIKYISPFFLLGSILLAFIGLRQTSIAYSHGKNQGERETEINDVFDTYNDIAAELCKRGKPNALIIIEDLDRISYKNIVIGFLRELYRFQNLLPEKYKSKMVFIISVKPEYELKLEKIDNFEDDKNTFTKLFDFVVNLKTIHVEDYENILLNIIGEDKESVGDLIDKKFDDRLPDSFFWLLQGKNLTIRNLKDRLNQAINLCINIKNKDYKNAYVNFKSCAAVTYLESTYGKEYYKLVNQETEFADVVRSSYIIRNDPNIADRKDKIKEGIKSSIFKGVNVTPLFIEDLTNMIFSGTIDDDFRMYFYSYPKGSYIKTSDEKDIFNLLLLPLENKEDEKLDEKVERILDKYENNQKNRKNIIKDCISQISLDINAEIKDTYPLIVLKNYYIFKQAIEKNYKAVLDTMEKELIWVPETTQIALETFAKIYNYDFSNKELLLIQYSERLYNKMKGIDAQIVINIRLELINILGDDIKLFNRFFISPDKPFITALELFSIKNISASLLLIDQNKININNIEYVAQKINENKLKKEDYKTSEKIYEKVISIANATIDVHSKSQAAKHLLDFLIINLTSNDMFFEYIYNKVKINELIDYINKLPIELVSMLYLNKLDELMISDGLSEQVIKKLESNNLYHTFILSMNKSSKLDQIDYSDERINDLIVEALISINEKQPKTVIAVRKAIIVTKNKDVLFNYSDLFHDNYPIITNEELNMFSDLSESFSYIDRTKVNDSNYEYFCEFFNAKSKGPDDCYSIFVNILDERLATSVMAPVIVKIVDKLDFSKIDFQNMYEEQQQDSCECIKTAMEFNNAEKCVAFMKRVNTLIESLERTVIAAGMKNEYILLINEIDHPTNYTIQWLKDNDIDFELSSNITEALFKEGEFTKYIIGETIYEEKLEFNPEIIDNKYYIEAYTKSDNAYEIMKNNEDFLYYILNKKLFVGFDARRCRPLYKLAPSIDLFEYVIKNLSETDLQEYIENTLKINNSEEAKRFVELATKGENKSKFTATEMQKSFKKILPSNSKTSFTMLMKNRVNN